MSKVFASDGAAVLSSSSSSPASSIKSSPARSRSRKLFSEVVLTGAVSVTGASITSVTFFVSSFGASGSGPKRIEKKSNDSSSCSDLQADPPGRYSLTAVSREASPCPRSVTSGAVPAPFGSHQ